MSRRKCRVDVDVADEQQHRDERRRRCPRARRRRRRRVQQHERHAAEGEQRERRARAGRCTRGTARRPTGTIRNGASEPISAALATLLCVAPAKKTARFRPKKTPGSQTWRTSAQRHAAAGAPQDHVPQHADDDQPPESDEDARRLRALDERRAQREGRTRPSTASTPSVFALSAPTRVGGADDWPAARHQRTLTATGPRALGSVSSASATVPSIRYATPKLCRRSASISRSSIDGVTGISPS